MKTFLIFLLFFIYHLSSAQVAINTTNTAAHSSAMLDITSTTKGLLIPRMTTLQRTSIASAAIGLIVMDITTNSLWYFNGTAWGELSSVNSNLWNTSSNNIYNTNTANVGIGTNSPGFPLNFSNSLGNKISLWGNAGAHYGFGIQNNLLQIHSSAAGTDIAFGYGESGSFTENMRITGNGNVGIGVSNPAFKLDIANRMRLRSGGANSSPGIWLNNIDNTGQVGFMGVFADDYMGWYGSGGASWNLLMNVNNGNVGIGIPNPAYKLDISNRMRIGYGGGTNTAGIYLNKSNNTEAAFMGMKDDTYIGWYGSGGAAWNLLMNINNGNVGIGNQNPAYKLDVSGDAKISGDANISGNANVTANAIITGEVRRPATGSANLVPICYGKVDLIGTIINGTGNFTIDWYSDGVYHLSISGEANIHDYIINVTTTEFGARFATASHTANNTILRIATYNASGTSTSTGFYFVVYKP